MDMTTIVVAASIPSAFTGFCFWLIEQNLKKRADNEKEEREERQKQLDEREQIREKNELCIINSDVPNAFATGRNPSHAAVAVTTGIMRVLDYNELSGVLGHELTHVKNRDILISTIAAAMAGVISWIANIAQWAAIFGVGRSDDDEEGGGLLGSLVTIIIAPIAAFLIQMAISRSREYAADKGGGEICGNPEYLASALAKIDYYAKHAQPLPDATPATAHMFIVNPLEGVGSTIMNLFSTHPATEDRIARLHAQAQARR